MSTTAKRVEFKNDLKRIELHKSGKKKMQFVWGIVGGSIDKNYVKPITDGFTAMMNNGILAGYNIDSMKVRVFDGSMHAVDSALPMPKPDPGPDSPRVRGATIRCVAPL